ncbi:MAG: hypothetical protein K6A23_05620 [Butyrivibrio sp.]|nr:hypothetical protein [Butyrivibrio sp.]
MADENNIINDEELDAVNGGLTLTGNRRNAGKKGVKSAAAAMPVCGNCGSNAYVKILLNGNYYCEKCQQSVGDFTS